MVLLSEIVQTFILADFWCAPDDQPIVTQQVQREKLLCLSVCDLVYACMVICLSMVFAERLIKLKPLCFRAKRLTD